IDTGYLDRNPDEFMPAAGPASPTLLVAAATAALLRQERAAHDAAQRSLEPGSPWAIADGWRLGHAGERLLVLRAGDERHEIHASGSSGRYQLRGLGEGSIQIEGAHIEGGRLSLRIDGRARSLLADADDQRVLVHDGDRRLHVELDSPFRFAGDAGEAGDDRVRAPMPGRVVLVRAAAGDSVEEGQELLVMEAMKMELALRAPRAGTIAEVRAAEGDFVEADAALVMLEPDPGAGA